MGAVMLHCNMKGREGAEAVPMRGVGATGRVPVRLRRAQNGGGLSGGRGRRLSAQCSSGEVFYSLCEAQVVIESWRCNYNTPRPQA